jgi:hypothetical protein
MTPGVNQGTLIGRDVSHYRTCCSKGDCKGNEVVTHCALWASCGMESVG